MAGFNVLNSVRSCLLCHQPTPRIRVVVTSNLRLLRTPRRPPHPNLIQKRHMSRFFFGVPILFLLLLWSHVAGADARGGLAAKLRRMMSLSEKRRSHVGWLVIAHVGGVPGKFRRELLVGPLYLPLSLACSISNLTDSPLSNSDSPCASCSKKSLSASSTSESSWR